PFSTADPNLASLADNGGPTNTHALQLGSPALEAGIFVNGLTTDQRGLTRPVDFPGLANASGSNGSDIGAFEAQASDLGGTLQFSSATYSVGESGPTVTITVTRTGGSKGAVGVRYATGNGTATQPADYTPVTARLNWADGDSANKTFTVPIVQDSVDELDETINLVLLSPSGPALLGTPGSAVLTITDDEAAPKISISNSSPTPFSTPAPVTEGNSGTTTAAHFTVTLDRPSSRPVSVRFATAPGTTNPANGQDAPDSGDFQNRRAVVTFPIGSTSRDVAITVNGDNLDEADETFFVNLSNPTNATIDDGQGVGTITDDDPTPTLSIGNALPSPVTEGNSGSTPASFTVTLSAASGQQVVVTYATANGTATGGTGGAGDYSIKSGKLLFKPGDPLTQTVQVRVNGDTIGEANETFFVNLLNPQNATIATGQGQGQGTINDDDSLPDLLVKRDSEAASDYALNNVYQSTPAGAQIETQLTDPGTAAVYQIKVENDSTTTQSLVVRAVENGASGFTLTYAVDGTDITADIKGVGYTTTNLAAGGNLVITVTVTPQSSSAPAALSESTLSVYRNSSDTTVRDAVKVRTLVQPAADLLIKLNSETGSAYALNNVYQSTPSGAQDRTQSTPPAATLVYLVKVENDSGTTRSFVVKAMGATDSSFIVKYRSGATVITSDILNADGFTTASLAPGANQVLAVEVTPRSGTASGASKVLQLEAFLNSSDTTVRDAVKATTTVP
ncbi:MAG: hypothetical protein M3347_04685, partial [Armatimonadota bacterium]|nr:hypothetical protein [Armatimonadota bacterium]